MASRVRRFRTCCPDQLREELPQVKATARLARQQQVRELEDPINALGKKIVEVAKSQPTISDVAWQATAELLNYRSFLNVTGQPSQPQMQPKDQIVFSWKLSLPFEKNASGSDRQTLWGFYPLVPSAEAARMEPLDGSQNASGQIGPSLVIVQSDALALYFL
jgi:hypothetical protein